MYSREEWESAGRSCLVAFHVRADLSRTGEPNPSLCPCAGRGESGSRVKKGAI